MSRTEFFLAHEAPETKSELRNQVGWVARRKKKTPGFLSNEAATKRAADASAHAENGR
jgi:hypothetical protein